MATGAASVYSATSAMEGGWRFGADASCVPRRAAEDPTWEITPELTAAFRQLAETICPVLARCQRRCRRAKVDGSMHALEQLSRRIRGMQPRTHITVDALNNAAQALLSSEELLDLPEVAPVTPAGLPDPDAAATLRAPLRGARGWEDVDSMFLEPEFRAGSLAYTILFKSRTREIRLAFVCGVRDALSDLLSWAEANSLSGSRMVSLHAILDIISQALADLDTVLASAGVDMDAPAPLPTAGPLRAGAREDAAASGGPIFPRVSTEAAIAAFTAAAEVGTGVGASAALGRSRMHAATEAAVAAAASVGGTARAAELARAERHLSHEELAALRLASASSCSSERDDLSHGSRTPDSIGAPPPTITMGRRHAFGRTSGGSSGIGIGSGGFGGGAQGQHRGVDYGAMTGRDGGPRPRATGATGPQFSAAGAAASGSRSTTAVFSPAVTEGSTALSGFGTGSPGTNGLHALGGASFSGRSAGSPLASPRERHASIEFSGISLASPKFSPTSPAAASGSQGGFSREFSDGLRRRASVGQVMSPSAAQAEAAEAAAAAAQAPHAQPQHRLLLSAGTKRESSMDMDSDSDSDADIPDGSRFMKRYRSRVRTSQPPHFTAYMGE